jgi:DNA-binding LacI/PurR family transcriptional regulator
VTHRRRATINDVASQAGVSPTTVSHVLSMRRPVAESTRKKVLDVIDELGYQPHGLARSLRMRQTNTVALIIPDITNPFYPVAARGLQDVLTDQRYTATVCNTDGVRQQELAFLEQMVARPVDGIVFVGFEITPEDLRPATRAGIPLVLVGPQFSPEIADVVGTDDRVGTAEATRYLLDKGIDRIGFIGLHTGGVGPSRTRVDGYEDALIQRGISLQPELVAPIGNYTREEGAQGMRRLLGLPEPPRAVVCVNDLVAIGALGVARECGFKVPEDVAIVGFDDIEAASLVDPPLTTVANPAYSLGQAAGRLLLSRLTSSYEGDYRRIVLPCHLVARDSA